MGRPLSSHLPKTQPHPISVCWPYPRLCTHTRTHTQTSFFTLVIMPHCWLPKVQLLTWLQVIKGSRHLDIVEGDRERSQRREGSGSSTSETFQVSPEEGGGGKKKKCFGNLSPVTRCLHGVIKDHLGFALKRTCPRIWVQAVGGKG